jgi:hypothetical protein
MLDTRCWILDAGCWIFGKPVEPVEAVKRLRAYPKSLVSIWLRLLNRRLFG